MNELKRIVNSKKFKGKDLKLLYELGISSEDLPKIRESFDVHGITDKRSGLYIANINEWENSIREKIAGVLKSFEEKTVILPGAGDTPRMFDNPAWQLLFIYKRFILSATQKLLIPALQGRPMALVQSMLVGWGMSMLADTVKDIIKGKEIPPIEKLAKESFFKMDLLGAVPEIYNLVFATLGVDGKTSYGNNIVNQLAGPAGGLLSDIALTGNARYNELFNDRPFTNADKNRLRRIIPLADHFALSLVVKKTLGIEEEKVSLKSRQKNKNLIGNKNGSL